MSLATQRTPTRTARARSKGPRRSTSHLKIVPDSSEIREQIKAEAARFCQSLDRSHPFSKDALEQWGRELLERLGYEEKHLGFTMVLLGNYFWKEQFLATPFERRMLLLPHCLKHAAGCPAEYSQFGLDCEHCGACVIADFKARAEQLGYKVLVAEGTPIVLKLIVGGYVDAILGVACLNVLEKAIDKVLLAGVPAYAIPLHSGDCKNTKFDESWVWEVIEQYEPHPKIQTSSYIPILRAANDLFEEDFPRLCPRVRTNGDAVEPFAPLVETEAIALEFLQNGGKRFRPFITLAAYDALRPDRPTNGAARPDLFLPISDSVRRTAMAIEAFHKASLVHDDIEDDDLFRYGKSTLHRRYDTSTAINVGDYLIGLGYRLVSRDRQALGAEVAADVIDRLGQAHVKLCEGQGAELRWRQAADKALRPIDAMKIYALKTAPAFEAALYCGVRLAGDANPFDESITAFCRHLGVGYQILNDLKDWNGDDHNKLVACQDTLALRPTLLLALALDGAEPQQRQELLDMIAKNQASDAQVRRLRFIFDSCKVFDKAERLVDKSRERALESADAVDSERFRQLLYFLVDTVLAPEPTSDAPAPADPNALPIIQVG